MSWPETEAPRGSRMPLVAAFLAVAGCVFLAGVLVGRSTYQTELAGRLAEEARNPAPAPRPRAGARTEPVAVTPQPVAPAEPVALAPIAFDPPELDFGVVRPGEAVTGTVQVVNESDHPLTIHSTRASCSCTTVDLANTVIPPHGRVPLTARFDGRLALGKKKTAVRVLIEGYAAPLQLDVRAEIALPVRASPAYIQAQDATNGELTISSMDRRAFRILAIDGEPPLYLDFDPETDEPRSSYRVAWDLRGYDVSTCRNADGKRMRGWWLVETDHPACPVFDIQVRHECTRPALPPRDRQWVLTERRVLLGQLEPGQSTEFTVGMKWFPRAHPNDTIHSIATESDDLTVELLEVSGSGALIDCRVRVTPRADLRGPFYTEVLFRSSQHAVPLVVMGRVADGPIEAPAGP